MNPTIVHVEKRFALNSPLSLPLDILHHQVDGTYHVFVSAAKAAYIVTDDLGADVVEAMTRGLTLSQVITSISESQRMPETVAVEAVRLVLFEIERNCFYADATAIDDVTPDLSMHCYLTRRCTLFCRHCYASAGPSVAADAEMGTHEWCRLFSDYSLFQKSRGSPGVITLSGGEPLLRGDLLELAAFAKSNSNRITLFTNGTLICTQKCADDLAKSFNEIQVSLDGATEDTADYVRGSGVFRKVMKALELLANTDGKVAIGVTLMPCNNRDLERNLANLLSPFGSKFEVRVGRAFLMGRADSSCTFGDDWKGAAVALQRILNSLYDTGLYKPRESFPNIRQCSCGYGTTIAVGSTGEVYGCSIESHPYGNVRTHAFADLAEKVQATRDNIAVDRVQGCCTCELRYACGGSCRVNNVLRTGSLFVTHCDSNYKKRILCELVARHLDKDRPVGTLAPELRERRVPHTQT